MKHSNFCPYCMSPVAQDGICSVCGLTRGSYTPQIHHLPPGTILKDRYLIGRVLGEGGFGITYIGCDLQLEVKVALKEYFPSGAVNRNASVSLTVTHYTGSEEAFAHDMNRFLKEARTMAKLSKQHTIVSVHDFFEENGTAYIVMEYIDGTTFKELVSQQGGKIASRELLYLIEPLFDALQAMHDAGLIHRDISPENIMLENGQVRLLDFGCAREATGDRTLTISLKHSYAPIEQYQGKGQGPWTDVHALGATIYYCVTGVKPPQAMDRLIDDELIPPRQLGADLTKTQEEAILKAMRVRPRQRFRSMTEFHAALYADVDRRVTPSILLTGAAAAVNVPEDEPEDADIDEKPAGLKKYALPGGIAAAVIAVILIIGIVMGAFSGSGTETAGTSGTDTSDTLAADTANDTADGGTEETAYQIRDGVAYVTDDEEETLLEALADDDVERVVVSGDTYIYTTETLELHKSLTLESGIYASSPVIVGEGGSITVDSQEGLCICGLLRTMDGGTVTVTSDGCMGDESAVLWLESWDDLTVEDGGTFQAGMGNFYGEDVITEGSSTWYYNVIDEDALFADAVSVDNEEDLREAAENGSAIIITGDITLTESFYQNVPVQIAEGVTVIALGTDQDLDEDGNIVSIDDIREEEFAWHVDAQTVLINHGSIKGDFYSNGEENDEPAAWVINDGTIDVSGEISGMLINLENGTCNLMHGTLGQGGVVNLGTFTHTPRLENDDMKMESYFFNSGTLLIEGTEDTGSYAWLVSGEMRNSASGIIEIGETAYMVNLTGIESQGRIILASDTSSFLNRGTLDMACQYVGTLEVAAGTFENTGIVKYTEDGYPYASEDAGAMSTDGAVRVTSASGLQKALQDDSINPIVIEGDITWEDGDLLISEKEIVLYGSLTVTGGDLTVENGVFWCSDGINLDGGMFTVQGLGVVCAGGISGCSELNIQASSTVVLENGDLYDMEINLNVGDGENGDATLTTKYDLSLYNCTMTLATENSYIYCWSFNQGEGSMVSTVGEEQITSYD